MATTLPSLSLELDQRITNTWMSIQAETIDNVLEATVLWAALKEHGCFTPQTGGDYITRTLRYNIGPSTKNVDEDDELDVETPQLKTVARWTWRTKAAPVVRNVQKDATNAGPDKVSSYIEDLLMGARDALVQEDEEDLLGAFSLTQESTDKDINSFNYMVPQTANAPDPQTTYYEFGGIDMAYGALTQDSSGYYSWPNTVANYWWGPKYQGWSDPVEANMYNDMVTLWNGIGRNRPDMYPDIIVTTQEYFEIYEHHANDKTQLVKDATTRLADLGYEVLRFKGKMVIWSPNMTADNMLMLNSRFIELVYNPLLWFEMSEWKPAQRSQNRVAHIFRMCQLISTRLNAHGRLETTITTT